MVHFLFQWNYSYQICGWIHQGIRKYLKLGQCRTSNMYFTIHFPLEWKIQKWWRQILQLMKSRSIFSFILCCTLGNLDGLWVFRECILPCNKDHTCRFYNPHRTLSSIHILLHHCCFIPQVLGLFCY